METELVLDLIKIAFFAGMLLNCFIFVVINNFLNFFEVLCPQCNSTNNRKRLAGRNYRCQQCNLKLFNR